jgi:hypothetical protein
MFFIMWIAATALVTVVYLDFRSNPPKQVSDGEKFFAFLMIFAVIGYLYSLTF